MATAAQTRRMNGTKGATVEDLSTQIAILKDDIAALTATMGDVGKAKVAEASSTASATAADLAEAGRAKAVETQEKAEEFIRTQPTTALGIAAGIGFLVGLMTVRR